MSANPPKTQFLEDFWWNRGAKLLATRQQLARQQQQQQQQQQFSTLSLPHFDTLENATPQSFIPRLKIRIPSSIQLFIMPLSKSTLPACV